MKKNYLLMATMASMLAFTACSDDASPLENGQNLGELGIDDGTTIELAVSNTGIGTRAARPMGSSAAANNVNAVKLMFYTQNAGNWAEDKNISAHTAGSKDAADPYTDNIVPFNSTVTEGSSTTKRIEESVKVRLRGLQANTNYRIVAYGYNDQRASGTQKGFPYGTVTAANGQDNAKSGLLQTGEHTLSGYDLEEVFAGSAEKKTKQGEAKFTTAPVVEITRQVAGILAYFKIPTYVNGEVVKTVKVVANDKSKGFKFPASFLATAKDFNGIDDATASTEELIEFDMSAAAANWNGGDPKDEYYTTGGDDLNGYTVPDTGAKGLATGYKKPATLVLKKDAFFGARFVLPYASDATGKTLQVKMYGAKDSATPIKTLTVKTNQTAFSTDPTDYDIRCNNFYSIGKKLASGNIEGKPDPENPDPQPEGPDTPIDLGATDQIVVEINDAWEVLHDMGVEEE